MKKDKDIIEEFDKKFTETSSYRVIDKRLKSGNFKYKYVPYERWIEKWDGTDQVGGGWVTPKIIREFLEQALQAQREEIKGVLEGMKKEHEKEEVQIGITFLSQIGKAEGVNQYNKALLDILEKL